MFRPAGNGPPLQSRGPLFGLRYLGYSPLLLCLLRALGWLMRKDQIEEGRISEHSKGLGTVTQKMVRARAREIALINGRSPEHLSPLDFSQAKQELMARITSSRLRKRCRPANV